MSESEDAGKYQVDNDGLVQGQVIGSHNTVEIYIHGSQDKAPSSTKRMQEQSHVQESASIFYSYTHEDEKLRKQLEIHLSLLRQQGLITEWHDRQVDAGIDWKQAIDAHLMDASIILLLISPDFLASDYCYGVEMQQALERHQRGEARVIPILLRLVDWEDAPFAYLQYLPRNRKPVTKWSNRDEAFAEIAKGLRAVITDPSSPRDTNSYLSAPAIPSASSLSRQENSFTKRTVLSGSQSASTGIAYQPTASPRRRSLSIFAWLINLFATIVLSTILKLIPSLEFIPFIVYIQEHQFNFLIIVCGAMLLTIIVSFIVLSLNSHFLPHRYFHSWSLVAGTSTISFVLSFSLLIIVLLQPSWCPNTLCHPPIVVSKVVTNPQGVHDSNLEAYFLAFESNSFVIPGDPANASPANVSDETNPHSICAILMESGHSTSIYRVALVVHSLYQGRYSILIDQVALVVIDQPVMPQHLNVWTNKSLVHYNANRYGIVYHGEGPSAVLPARYLESPGGYTQLILNEADQLDIQISSQVPVDLKFQMQVTYHIATETKRYTLRIPEVFEVMFSNQSNWHSFQLQSGHFVAVQ